MKRIGRVETTWKIDIAGEKYTLCLTCHYNTKLERAQERKVA